MIIPSHLAPGIPFSFGCSQNYSFCAVYHSVWRKPLHIASHPISYWSSAALLVRSNSVHGRGCARWQWSCRGMCKILLQMWWSRQCHMVGDIWPFCARIFIDALSTLRFDDWSFVDGTITIQKGNYFECISIKRAKPYFLFTIAFLVLFFKWGRITVSFTSLIWQPFLKKMNHGPASFWCFLLHFQLLVD